MSKYILRAISIFTLFFFLWQNTGLTAPELAQVVVPPPAFTASEFQIDIPADLGNVETARAGSEDWIVHIQDAHGDYEAQKHIASIIGHLVDRYGFRLVLTEGASESLDPQYFHFFDDHSLNLSVADTLMRHGAFTGSEMFLLAHGSAEKNRVRIRGVEDAGLYRRDVTLFRRAVRQGKEKSLREYQRRLKSYLGRLESRTFSSDLRDFMKEWRMEREGGSEIIRFLRALEKIAKAALYLDLSDPGNQDEYPFLTRTIKLKDLESKLRFPEIQKEKEAVLRRLEGKIDPELYDRLSRLKTEPGRHAENPRFLLERVFEQARERGIDLGEFANFSLFLSFLIFRHEIEAPGLFEEADRLSEKILEALAKTAAEKKLVGIIRDAMLQEDLFRLEVSRQEFGKAEALSARIRPSAVLARMEELRLEVKSPEQESGGAGRFEFDPDKLAAVDRRFEKAVEFYRLAQERETHFIQKAMEHMKSDGVRRAVLVTGGFHTAGVQERIKEKGFSYHLVTPKMNGAHDSREIYLRAMMGRNRFDPLAEADQRKDPAEDSQIMLAAHLVSQQAQLGLLDVNRERAARLLEARNRFLALVLLHHMVRQAGARLAQEKPYLAPYLSEAIAASTPAALRGGVTAQSLGTETPAGSAGTFDPFAGSLPGYSVGKAMTLLEHLRPHQLPLADYQGAGPNAFDALRQIANAKLGRNIFPDLDQIESVRIKTVAQSQAQYGRAIHELTKNGLDWSVTSGGVPLDRSGQHGQGALQVLSELGGPGEYAVIETRKGNAQGLRVILWNAGNTVNPDYRMYYEFADGLEQGTSVSVMKPLDEPARAARRELLVDKLKVHTGGAVIVNDERINRPEDYFYDGPADKGKVDDRISTVEVTINERGFTVRDHGQGMDLKDFLENFLIPHYGKNGVSKQKDRRSPKNMKLFVRPETSRVVRVERWINGHQVEVQQNQGDERLNVVRELVLDFPPGTHAPSSWDRVEFDRAALDGMRDLIQRVTDPGREVPNRFAVINALAVSIRSIPENPRAAQQLMQYLKERTQQYLRAREKAGERLHLVPNRLHVPGTSHGWAAFDHGRFTPLDEELFEFNMGRLSRLPGVTEPPAAFTEQARGNTPALANVPILLADWNFRETVGSPAVWLLVEGRPVILVDRAVYERHAADSSFWFDELFDKLAADFAPRFALARPAEDEKPKVSLRQRLSAILAWFRSTWKFWVVLPVAALIVAGTLYVGMRLSTQYAMPEEQRIEQKLERDFDAFLELRGKLLEQERIMERHPRMRQNVRDAEEKQKEVEAGILKLKDVDPGKAAAVEEKYERTKIVHDDPRLSKNTRVLRYPEGGWHKTTEIRMSDDAVDGPAGTGTGIGGEPSLFWRIARWPLNILMALAVLRLLWMVFTGRLNLRGQLRMFTQSPLTTLQQIIVQMASPIASFFYNPRQYGYRSPFDDDSGGTGQGKKASSPVYGRITNMPVGYAWRQKALVMGYSYYDENSEPLVLQVRKSVVGSAQPVSSTPVTVEMWGRVKAGTAMPLLNYHEGIIEDVEVERIDSLDTRNPLPGPIGFTRTGDELVFDENALVVVRYKIHLYDPKDIAYMMYDHSAPAHEIQAVDANFGNKPVLGARTLYDLRNSSTDQEKLEAVRKLKAEKGYYAFDEKKNVRRQGSVTWIAAMAKQVDDFGKCGMTCATASTFQEFIGAYLGLPFVELDMVIPEGNGNLSTALDGHAASIFRIQEEGRTYWHFEESTSNLGLPPVLANAARVIGKAGKAVSIFFTDAFPVLVYAFSRLLYLGGAILTPAAVIAWMTGAFGISWIFALVAFAVMVALPAVVIVIGVFFSRDPGDPLLRAILRNLVPPLFPLVFHWLIYRYHMYRAGRVFAALGISRESDEAQTILGSHVWHLTVLGSRVWHLFQMNSNSFGDEFAYKPKADTSRFAYLNQFGLIRKVRAARPVYDTLASREDRVAFLRSIFAMVNTRTREQRPSVKKPAADSSRRWTLQPQWSPVYGLVPHAQRIYEGETPAVQPLARAGESMLQKAAAEGKLPDAVEALKLGELVYSYYEAAAWERAGAANASTEETRKLYHDYEQQAQTFTSRLVTLAHADMESAAQVTGYLTAAITVPGERTILSTDVDHFTVITPSRTGGVVMSYGPDKTGVPVVRLDFDQGMQTWLMTREGLTPSVMQPQTTRWVDDFGGQRIITMNTNDQNEVQLIPAGPRTLVYQVDHTKQRLEFLVDFAEGKAEAAAQFKGREKIWVEWLLFGTGLSFEETEPLNLPAADEAARDEVAAKLGAEFSLGWLIDAAKLPRHELGLNGSVSMTQVRKALVLASQNQEKPISEREMLGTISAQDRTRMVMIRELIQNARDAVRQNLAALRAAGRDTRIKVRSYLNELGGRVRWIVSVYDPVGMSLETLFLKYFPPKATTKSVEELIKDLLRRHRTDEQKIQAIMDLFEEVHQSDAALRDRIRARVEEVKDPEAVALEIMQEHSARFKKALGTGFFGVGNYTIYADSNEVVIRTGKDGKVHRAHVRVDRADPDDPEKVTGLVLLSLKEYEDPKREYEGTLIQRIKNIDDVQQIHLEDRKMKYLFAEYVGAVDDAEVVFVNEDGSVQDVPVKDTITVLADRGRVKVVRSAMGITRLTVDRLFIQGNRDPALYQFVPDWALRWMDENAVGLDYEAGTPPTESRTSLSNPIAERHETTIAILQAAVAEYRKGNIKIPGVPEYGEFLRDTNWQIMAGQSPAVISDARAMTAQSLGEERWPFYAENPRALVGLLLHMDVPLEGERVSLRGEKENLYFGQVPEWVLREFEQNPAFRQRFALKRLDAAPPALLQPNTFSMHAAAALYQTLLELYLENRAVIPGLPPAEAYLSPDMSAIMPVQAVSQDAAKIRNGEFDDLDLTTYRQDSTGLLQLLVSLPIHRGQSLNDMKESVRQKIQREAASASPEMPEAGRPRAPAGAEAARRALPAAVQAADYDVLGSFARFLDLIFAILDANVPPDRKSSFRYDTTRWEISGPDLETLSTFDRFLRSSTGDSIYAAILRKISSGESSQNIAFYASLLSGNVSIQEFRAGADAEAIFPSLERLAERSREGLIYFEHTHQPVQDAGLLKIASAAPPAPAAEAPVPAEAVQVPFYKNWKWIGALAATVLLIAGLLLFLAVNRRAAEAPVVEAPAQEQVVEQPKPAPVQPEVKREVAPKPLPIIIVPSRFQPEPAPYKQTDLDAFIGVTIKQAEDYLGEKFDIKNRKHVEAYARMWQLRRVNDAKPETAGGLQPGMTAGDISWWAENPPLNEFKLGEEFYNRWLVLQVIKKEGAKFNLTPGNISHAADLFRKQGIKPVIELFQQKRFQLDMKEMEFRNEFRREDFKIRDRDDLNRDGRVDDNDMRQMKSRTYLDRDGNVERTEQIRPLPEEKKKPELPKDKKEGKSLGAELPRFDPAAVERPLIEILQARNLAPNAVGTMRKEIEAAERNLRSRERAGIVSAIAVALIAQNFYYVHESPEVRRVIRQLLNLDEVRVLKPVLTEEEILNALESRGLAENISLWRKLLVEENLEPGVNIVSVSREHAPADLLKALNAVRLVLAKNPNKALVLAYEREASPELVRWIEDNTRPGSVFLFGRVTDYAAFLSRLAGQTAFAPGSADHVLAKTFRGRFKEIYQEKQLGLQKLLNASLLHGQPQQMASLPWTAPKRFEDDLAGLRPQDRLIAQLTLGVPISGMDAAALLARPPDYLTVNGRASSLQVRFDPAQSSAIAVFAQAMLAIQAIESAA